MELEFKILRDVDFFFSLHDCFILNQAFCFVKVAIKE